MRTSLFIKVVLVLSVLFSIGCTKDEPDNDREYITTCYRFINKRTRNPIVGRTILIHYGGVLSQSGKTDEDGVCCFEHWSDNRAALLHTYVLDQAYWNVPVELPLNGIMNTVELTPKSWIDFHIVNTEPSNEGDYLDVRYICHFINESGYHVGYGGSRPFEGENIDTHWKAATYPGRTDIEWTVKENGIIVDQGNDYITIGYHGGEVDFLIEY